MGKLIHHLAEEKGYEITVVIVNSGAGSSAAELAEKLLGADAAIDFTTADAVRRSRPRHPPDHEKSSRSRKLFAMPYAAAVRSRYFHSGSRSDCSRSKASTKRSCVSPPPFPIC
ncbi:MAG: hypothetical protein IPQ00_10835 [Chloracidobacterium sp.]|nr:hypothetical protein [Chloracidobacterium sp.]